MMSASLPVFGRICPVTRQIARARKPTHGTYLFVRRFATAFRAGFHGADLSHLWPNRHGLDSLASASLHHRHHFLRRPSRRRTLVSLSSLLQSRRLGHRRTLHVFGQAGRHAPGRRGATLLWAVDDTPCAANADSPFGGRLGMHHDPLISSRRAKPLVSVGGTIGSCLCLIVVHPFWGADCKVFALPIAVRLYRNRQRPDQRQEEKRQASPRPHAIIARGRNWPSS